ncbi:S1C family serine protease [Roseibacillus ishigakijimensis]|uniref:Serine protease n=1 Tax=Roseibacillus ishigakijimensis TaxID=454146 RepID=A0A934RWF8_9BACT|nr:S1C family serine protease [Roseibacillus ishigakijimensis]MBK1835410.1 serine protease [Roseibacillus ishigakijimensis]
MSIRIFLLTFTSSLLALAAEVTSPPLVLLSGYHTSPAEQDQPVNRALGFITEEEGFLLSNFSNLTDPTSGVLLPHLQAHLGEESYEVRVIGIEPTLDLGILQLVGDGPFPAAHLDPTHLPELGEKVAACQAWETGGERAIATGAIIGLNTRECYQESLSSTMFRIDLDLSPALAGGPIFDPASGRVLAIHTGFQPTQDEEHIEEEALHETHVLPISLCLNIYDTLKLKKSLRSPWTGFSVKALTAEQENYFPTSKGHQGGVALEAIWPGGPAEKLGLKENDILLQFSYNYLNSVADFQKWLYMYGVGEAVTLTILRDGKDLLRCDYTIEERPAWAKPK